MLNTDIINAIEEADFTPELTTALLAKVTPQRATEYLQTAGHIVKAKADYDKDVDTKAEEKADVAIKGEAARFWNDIDGLLTKLSKESKPAGMKTSVWYDTIKTKIDLPEEGDPVKRGQIEALQKKVEELSKKQETPTIDIVKETNRLVKSSLKGLEVPIPATATTDALKETAKKAGIATIDAVFKSTHEYGGETTDGEPYFVLKGDTKKTPIVNTDGEPLTAAEIVEQKYPQLLAVKGHKQSGGGTKGDPDPGATTEKDIYIAAEKLHKPGSLAWKTYVNQAKKDAGIK